MPDTSTAINRDQRPDFSAAMSHLRSRIELPEGTRALGALSEAAVRFGTCELGLRRPERLHALGLREHRATRPRWPTTNTAWRRSPACAPSSSTSFRSPPTRTLALWRDASLRLREDSRRLIAERD